ncbi:MAG: nucleoside hydrolase [Planctomycetota bacterium]|jgi:inosine-uridine nucleoside N-ribohydrolase
MADEKIKVLFDTDIGSDIDDAVALAYLLCEPRCELLGVTTVSGEAIPRAEMASAVCRNVGRDDVPVHAGCTQALLTDIPQKRAPQAEALGQWDRRRDFEPNTAVGFLRQTIRAHPGEVTLLTVGPLTNISLLFATDPEVPSLLKDMVMMCGRFFDSMGGEWNAINDPHATAIAYGNGRQSRPPRHVSYGLDVTTKCHLDADACRRRFTARALKPVRDFAEIWFRGRDRITFHDPLAAASIFQPDLCEYREGKVTVSLDEPTLGWTVFTDRGDDKPHTLACNVDPDRFFERYFDVVR